MTNEEIRKAAFDYTEYSDNATESMDCFIEGAKWALGNQWISADDDLPNENEDVILYAEGLYFHCRFEDGKFIIIDGFPVGVYTDGKYIYSSKTYNPNIVIDYWIPIPKIIERN